MNIHDNKQKFYLPHIGQRIVKTSIAVLITLLVYYVHGYRGAEMPAGWYSPGWAASCCWCICAWRSA